MTIGTFFRKIWKTYLEWYTRILGMEYIKELEGKMNYKYRVYVQDMQKWYDV